MRTKATCAVVSALLAVALAGCQQNVNDPLAASAASLDQHEYEQAIVLANESLEEDPAGAKAAEALYLRGQVYELSPARSQAQMQANLQAARSSYVEALRHNPPTKLATYIRAALGKVAFYQDDFAIATQQLWTAYSELDDKDLKAATLYHLGKAQQRSGQFQQADQTFQTLLTTYSSSGWALKAAEVRGGKAFYLQLGIYSKPESLESAAKLVEQRGMKAVKQRDDKGRYILRAGPYSSYASAKQMRPKVADAFPDATIVP